MSGFTQYQEIKISVREQWHVSYLGKFFSEIHTKLGQDTINGMYRDYFKIFQQKQHFFKGTDEVNDTKFW